MTAPFQLPPGWVAPFGLDPSLLRAMSAGASGGAGTSPGASSGGFGNFGGEPGAGVPGLAGFDSGPSQGTASFGTPGGFHGGISPMGGSIGYGPASIGLGIGGISPSFSFTNDAFSNNALNSAAKTAFSNATGMPSGYSFGLPGVGMMGSFVSGMNSLNSLAQALGVDTTMSLMGGKGMGTVTGIGGEFGSRDFTNAIYGLNQRGELGSPKTGIQADDANGPVGPVGFTGMGVPGIAEAMSDTPGVEGGDGGGGGGGGSSHLCTLFHETGKVDLRMLAANNRFRRSMTADEYRGYSAWAEPLVAFCRRHPRVYKVLYTALGWAPRAYMAEIKQPGSSRLGKALLTGGLWSCRWLGSRV